jgi:hypothetical protein
MSDQPDDVDEEALLRGLLGDQPRARPHHYLFAHRVLPGRLWQNPSWFLETLYSEHTLGFLLTRWGEAAMGLDESEFLPPEEKLRCNFFDLAGGYRAAVISLPEARFVTEAHMVAMVSRPEQRRWLFFKTDPVLRYFTLEYGLCEDLKTPRTVLCEWTPNAHLNYDTGPAANPEAFLGAIEALLSKSGQKR